MNAASRMNNFLSLWRAGYTRLVPVVPVGAQVSETSALNRPGAVGKAVGVRGRNELWHGFDWVKHECDEDDLARWHAMGADIGIKGGAMPDGTWLIWIDADTQDERLATLIEQHTLALSPESTFPKRVGQHPKAAYPVRVSGEYRYARVEFGGDAAVGVKPERVELLGEGRYCKVKGLHPVTRQPYTWPRPLPPYAELPLVAPADLDAFLSGLRAVLPSPSPVKREGAASVVNQKALKADPELVRKAVRAMPNTSVLFPTRESYLEVGYTIKAAMPDDEAAAFALFEEWAERWTDGVNEPRVLASDWARMKPPFRIGAGRLFEIAAAVAPEDFTRADQWFDPAACTFQSGEGAAETSALFGGSGAIGPDDVFEMLSLREILNMPDPRFVIARHIPEQSVGFLYGDPGTGKSFIALDWALHLAFGKSDWHGDAVEADSAASVIYLAGEGAQGMKTRVRAWARRHGVSDAELEDGRFQLIRRGVNMMQPEQVVKLARTIKRGVTRASFVVADTVSRAMPGADENAQKEMTLFVKACDVLRDTFECVVLGVHHTSKKGEMRGSTVLLGAGDFVFKLERAKGAPIGKLICEKQKDAPDGWDDPYRFDVVNVPGGSSLVPSRCATSAGPDIQLTPDLSASVLDAMRTAWEAGEPWGATYHAGERHAPRRMVREFGFTAEKAEELVALWLGMGLIVEDTASAKTKKRGFRVVGDIQTDIHMDDLFG